MRAIWLLPLVCAVALSACEKSQVMAAKGKGADAPAWQGTNNAYVASGWKQGDATSWETQMRTRSQGQNEYARTGNTQP
jgi:hypothetical protein